jgi:integrase
MRLEKLKARGCEHLYRHPKFKTFYFRRYTKETGEVTRSLRTTDLTEAKEKRDQMLRGSRKAVVQKKTALELYDDWITRKKAMNLAPATIYSIENTRLTFAPWFAGMMPDEITADWWEAKYVPSTKKTHGGDRRFFNAYKWLNSFLKQLHEDGVIRKLPRIKNPDPKRSVGRVLSDEEVGTLLNFAQSEDLYLAILMASTMGMRRGEIYNLRAEDVNLAKGTIRLVAERTKTRKEREFAISPAALLLVWQRAQKGSQWIFPSKVNPCKAQHRDGYKTGWLNLKKMTGIKCRFHDLRHTFLTKAFAAPGANPALICHYAGLSLEVAERVYLHLNDEHSRQVAGLVTYDV